MLLRLFTVTTLCCAVSATFFNYKLHESNDEAVNDCVEAAIRKITSETCVYWQESDDEGESITFLQSGHCSWQASNKTVHLSPSCIKDDECLDIIAKVHDVEQPRRHIIRHLNLKFNCTEKCTTECHNGGILEANCTCTCQYGFNGPNCENLRRSSLFTDNTCGFINAEQSGTVHLSTYPNFYNKNTFCQWHIKSADPWDVIELTFDDFDLDDTELPPGSHCNDVFAVYGALGVENPFPCPYGERPKKIRSETNWLLIELRTMPFSNERHGPSFQYQVINTKTGLSIYASTKFAGIQTLSEEQTSFTKIAYPSFLAVFVILERLF